MSCLPQLRRMLSPRSATYQKLSTIKLTGVDTRVGIKQAPCPPLPRSGASNLKTLWCRLPVELRQKIFLTTIEGFLEPTRDEWKGHLRNFDRAIRTIADYEGLDSWSIVWPLQKIRDRLAPELERLQMEVAQLSEALGKIWSQWTNYSFTTAPAGLQKEALEKDHQRVRREVRLRRSPIIIT